MLIVQAVSGRLLPFEVVHIQLPQERLQVALLEEVTQHCLFELEWFEDEEAVAAATPLYLLAVLGFLRHNTSYLQHVVKLPDEFARYRPMLTSRRLPL